MTIEPWMLRTGLVIAALNCVNGLLLWIAHRLEAGQVGNVRSVVDSASPQPAVPLYARREGEQSLRRSA